MTLPIVCPYPACSETFTTAGSLTACACHYRQTISACAACGIANRGGAAVCRRCRIELPSAALDTRALHEPQAAFLSMRGGFRRPPVVAQEFLYALSVDGGVIRLSPRANAASRQVARLASPDAAFNRAAAVRVANSGKGLKGWTLLALSSSAVEAVSLATGTASILYQAARDQRLVANASEADATDFKGLVATADFCAFAVRPAPGEAVLTLRYFSEDRALEQPLRLRGAKIMGPALCGGRLALCSEHEVGLFDPATGTAAVVDLPRGFLPLLSRASLEVNVPPGHLPLTVALSPQGRREAWVGGHSQQGTPGFLRVDFDAHQTQFEPRPGLHTIVTNPDGTLCAARTDGFELIGHPAPKGRASRMQPGMPLLFDQGHLGYFPEQPAPGRHRLFVGSEQGARELPFTDPLCTVESCCGILFVGAQIVVASLNLAAPRGGGGLNLALWSSAL